MKHNHSIRLLLSLVVALIATTNIPAQNWDMKGNSNNVAEPMLGTTNGFPVKLVTNNITRMKIDVGGNVGIGTTSPTQMLDVAGRGLFRSMIVSNNGSIPGINPIFRQLTSTYTENRQSVLTAYGTGMGLYSEGTGNLSTGIFSVGGSVGMISQGNTTGVGAYGNGFGVYAYSLNTGVQAEAGKIGIYGTAREGVVGKGSENGVHGYGRMIGVCGNGTEDGWGGYFLSEKGSGLYASTSKADKNYAAVFNGNVLANEVLKPSDIRLKTNIKPLGNAIGIIKTLKPRSYEFRADQNIFQLPEGIHYGFIAQDVEEVLPGLVKEVNTNALGMQIKTVVKNNYKSVNYIELIPILTKALQEQQQVIENQQRKINELTEQVSEILKRLSSITNVAPGK